MRIVNHIAGGPGLRDHSLHDFCMTVRLGKKQQCGTLEMEIERSARSSGSGGWKTLGCVDSRRNS